MNNVNDFVIENGVLKKYVGPGGDVIVPGKAKIIGTGAFSNRSDVTGIVLSEGTKSVQKYAFDGVLSSTITEDMNTNIIASISPSICLGIPK